MGAASKIRKYLFVANGRGLTVVELLIVISIFAIISAVGFPKLAVWLPDYRLRRAVNELYGDLQQARLTAVRNSASVTISYSTGPDQYVIDLLTVPSQTLKTVTLADYGSGINFDSPGGITFSVSGITFNSRGTSNAGYAYLTNDTGTAYYRIGPLTSGVVRLQKYNGSTWE